MKYFVKKSAKEERKIVRRELRFKGNRGHVKHRNAPRESGQSLISVGGKKQKRSCSCKSGPKSLENYIAERGGGKDPPGFGPWKLVLEKRGVVGGTCRIGGWAGN